MFALSELNPRAVNRRRIVFLCGNLLLLGLGTALLVSLLADWGWSPLSVILLVLFVLLQIPVVFGFMLAATGAWLLARGGDPMRITNTRAPEGPPRRMPPTAIVVPIFNEDVNRVFQGLQVMHESLQKTGHGEDFDFAVLSDSNDPNFWIAEEKAWLELCKRCRGLGRIFYRKRRVSLHHKSGNIADFCRRWGARYRYMIVLDADSIMTGTALVRLVELMEQNRQAGIIQTNPKPMGAQSLFQRIMQFSAHVYGAPFTAGMNFWQLSSGNYWGHNAIVRIEPFMKYCAMPELPKANPLGTRILSHDTVEAAFMRRAGYGVWFAYDIEGSYEELPPNLLAWLQRDQRWCFGNLQHIWLLLARGIRTPNRIHILNGILGYASSLFWLLFLLVGTMVGVKGPVAHHPAPGYFPAHAVRAVILYIYVIALLLVPKILGVQLWLRAHERAKAVGRRGKVLLSAIIEIGLSTLIAPIQMLFYSRFVLASITGTKIVWGGQTRGGGPPSWRQLISAHLMDMCLVLAWAAFVAWAIPSFLPWLALVFIGPILAIPLSRITASTALGQYARRKGLFLIAEEMQPPPELQNLDAPFLPAPSSVFQAREYASDYGLLQAVLDPYINAAHVSLLHQRSQVSVRSHEFMHGLSAKLLLDGPFALTPREKRMLLWDGDAMEAAHAKLWSSPSSYLHDWWQVAFRHYNESSALSLRRSV